MQTKNPFLDDFAQLMTSFMGAAQTMGDEAQALFRSNLERFMADMDLVRRDEFEAIKAELDDMRAERLRLVERIAALEAGMKTTAATNE